MNSAIGLLIVMLTMGFLMIGTDSAAKFRHKNSYEFNGTHCFQIPQKGKSTVLNLFAKIYNAPIVIRNIGHAPGCMEDFENIALTPECGSREFDLFAYCAKVRFYGEKGLDAGAEQLLGPKTKKEALRSQPYAHEEAFKNKGQMQDMIMVLLDGCITCPKQNKKETVTVDMTLFHINHAGKIPDVCPYEETPYKFAPKILENDNGTKHIDFKEMVILHERLCPEIHQNGKTVISPLSYEHQIKLVVEHDCLSTKIKQIITFPNISVHEDAHAIDHH